VVVVSLKKDTYDHVPPPTTINPDGKTWINDGVSQDPSFDFTRLGVRVPAVLISPYIPPGVIDHRVYDHSSIIATALKLFLPNVAGVNLTLRDKNANTFEDNLTLQQPRTDNIDLGAGAKSEAPTAAELNQPINDHLKMLVRQAAMMAGDDPDKVIQSITTEAQASAYLQSYAKAAGANYRMEGNAHGLSARSSDLETCSCNWSSWMRVHSCVCGAGSGAGC